MAQQNLWPATRISYMKIIVFFACALALSACSATNEFHYVSMSALLAVPEKYIGKKVETVGFLHETNYRIYMTEDHARVNDNPSSLFIDFSRLDENTSCRGKYVAVRGMFGPIDFGESVKYLGLTDIEQFENQETLRKCFGKIQQ